MEQENSQTWSVGCSDGWQKLECSGVGVGVANTECGNGSGEVHVT